MIENHFIEEWRLSEWIVLLVEIAWLTQKIKAIPYAHLFVSHKLVWFCAQKIYKNKISNYYDFDIID